MLRTRPDRWEQGSEYHWLDPARPVARRPSPWSAGLLLFSGRDALRLILEHGVRERGWRRLWVPEYFCQHVIAALVRPDLPMRPYPDHPLRSRPDFPDTRRGDVVFLANYFGLRGTIEPPRRDGVEILEDHTHDPDSAWARATTADFAVVSLRKTLPLSDGGALWSPRGHPLPPAPALTPQRRRAAATKLSAMILKAMYLGGHPVAKETYRRLALRGERGLGAPGVSAMSEVAHAVLHSYPIDRWRRARASNHALLRRRLSRVRWLRVLRPPAGCVPFSFAVEIDSAGRRERVRRRLIDSGVFPAVLWPLEDTVLRVGAEARAVSRRMLSIHCDGRYGSEELQRVGDLLTVAGEV